MLYQDKSGHVMLPEEVDELSAWEVDELGIRILEEL